MDWVNPKVLPLDITVDQNADGTCDFGTSPGGTCNGGGDAHVNCYDGHGAYSLCYEWVRFRRV